MIALMRSWPGRHRRLVAVVGTTATLLAGLTGASASAGASPLAAAPAHSASHAVQHLAVTSLSFAKRTVDVTAASVHVGLRWTITDSRSGARSVSGTLTIAAPEAGHPGKYVSQQVGVTFALKGKSKATAHGTARKSSFSYSFDVPRYARVSEAHWQVVAMTVRDNKGDKLTLSASRLSKFKAVLTATEVVDSSGPTFISLQFAGPGGLQYGFAVPQFAYSGPGAAPAAADVCLYADPAGFAAGSLELTGPGGRTITVPFTLKARDSQQAFCDYAAQETYGQNYLLKVTFPVGTADGAWNPTKVSLSDTIGNVTTATDVATDAENITNTVTVTADDVLTASHFASSPNPVDDWLAQQYVTLSMITAGASGGMDTVDLAFANDAYPYSTCDLDGNTPINGSGSQVSVSFTMAWEAADCDVTGLAIADGAGQSAVYGSLYGAPDPHLNITQVPDTTPPVATSVSISPDLTNADLLTIGETAQVAPVDELGVRVYNSGGVLQPSASDNGGAGPEPPTGAGTITDQLAFGTLAPGTYTVGFTITDEGGLSATYGPGGNPMPGGPLTFTVS
jgi:hypothetical protein